MASSASNNNTNGHLSTLAQLRAMRDWVDQQLLKTAAEIDELESSLHQIEEKLKETGPFNKRNKRKWSGSETYLVMIRTVNKQKRTLTSACLLQFSPETLAMDRNHWMYKLKRSDDEYLAGLGGFLKTAEENRLKKGESYIWCPCKDCENCQNKNRVIVEEHHIRRGFMRGYTCWSRHGETLDRGRVVSNLNEENVDSNNVTHDNLSGMLLDCEDDVVEEDYEKFQDLFDDSEKPLYDGCKKYTKLSAVLKLFNLKANGSWSDTSFTSLLAFLNDMLPEGNEMPVSTYKAKKLLCPMGMEIERIHACPNDCMLYRNEYSDLHNCITCGTSRYKRKNHTEESNNTRKNGPPAKVLWYLPIVPRLKRLFANPKDAKLMRWHAEERKIDGKIRHVADSPQWRNIDSKFEDFGRDIRNIRFGLNPDGINPFGTLSSRHSPKQPGNDIDVYLAPLIEDMKKLWSPGVEMYDAFSGENFQLRAMIYCTISDFPAYGNLSGYSTKGAKACPVCEDDTQSLWVPKCKKTVYMDHRRYLPCNHPYRRLLLDIKGKSKDGKPVREDMKEMGIRPELAPVESPGKRTFLPAACYTMSKAEKTKFCKCLHGVKVPSGYSSNIKKLVSMKEIKLLGMKSHDCHVLLTQMIPIAIRGILPDRIRHTITKLCLFFNMINSKVINPEVLDSWQSDIILTLCQLEMYFPPSFFDVMVHLICHIVNEIKYCGPVFLRYMYQFERYMGVLKGYVKNRYRPEGSFIEGYATEEVIEYCTDYLQGVTSIGVPISRHKGRLVGVGSIGLKTSFQVEKISSLHILQSYNI
ncbi:hypothetical protein LXL04_004560 [Taraxacum kok-saghyz]